MKSRVIYCLNFIWSGLIAFLLPICFEIIYMNITGHAKGYDYDLGAEKDISVMFGCMELLIWLVLALPSIICVIRKTMAKGRIFLLIPAVLYTALAVISINIIYGGWSEYVKEVFNI